MLLDFSITTSILKSATLVFFFYIAYTKNYSIEIKLRVELSVINALRINFRNSELDLRRNFVVHGNGGVFCINN